MKFLFGTDSGRSVSSHLQLKNACCRKEITPQSTPLLSQGLGRTGSQHRGCAGLLSAKWSNPTEERKERRGGESLLSTSGAERFGRQVHSRGGNREFP